MSGSTLYTVIPCYNEQEVLSETCARLLKKYAELADKGFLSEDSRILFVDDGSKDRTWEMIQRLHEENQTVSGLKLSRNKGHQNALMAGLLEAGKHADIIVSMDADLQDDIGVLDGFLEQYRNGCEVVYGVRSSRQKDTVFKRSTAGMFYRFMGMMGVEIVPNHADCRLLSKRAVEALSQYREVNLFLRGLIPMLGFQSTVVTYERGERFAGESKYPLKKMLAFAFDGITSLSVKPIRLILAVGVVLFAVSIIMLIYTLIQKIIGNTVAGWAFLNCSIWMIGGIQLLSLGVIGEYVGKIYSEAKARPRYIVETFLNS